MAWRLRWPIERRAASLTEAAIRGLVSQAKGTNDGPLAVLEAGSIMWGSAIGSARVSGHRADALIPTLSNIGRAIVTRGYWAALVEVGGGSVTLREVASLDPLTLERWRVNLCEPNRTVTREVERAQLLILPWATRPGRPHEFVNPSQAARGTFDLLQSATGHGQQSLGSRLRWLLSGDRLTADQRADYVLSFENAMRENDKFLLTGTGKPEESLSSITTETDESLPLVLREAERSTATALGIPPVFLGLASNDPRAAARRFAATVESKLAELEREARLRLDSPDLTIALKPTEDLQARARAFGILTRGPEPPFSAEQAAAIVGLDTS